MAGIQEATQMVTSYFDPATKLIYAIGAVIGLIGGVRVYQKFSSGDPDTSKTAASRCRRSCPPGKRRRNLPNGRMSSAVRPHSSAGKSCA
mgnify:CR=1 FL=1